MTVTVARPARARPPAGSERYRLHRGGILNVWQYDEHEFAFADGRLLLRGANGAGKSKTLEMLLPFALDGDKARITASAKHHTSLLWLMTDGYGGQARVGYVWVEFRRLAPDGAEDIVTCGVGMRASSSARAVTAWHFVTTRRIGHDLFLEDDAGPLQRAGLAEAIGADGQVFEKASAYKEHVGRVLFGLDLPQYDDVLRLLYWLRQPQIGEDIEPAKLAQQLSYALPQLDEQAVRSAGDTFDELTAFGEQIERRAAAAEALQSLARAYADYARGVVAQRARAVTAALQTERRLRKEIKRTKTALDQISGETTAAEQDRGTARASIRDDEAKLRALEASPEFRDQVRLDQLADQAARDGGLAEQADERRRRQANEVDRRVNTEDTRRRRAQEDVRQYAADLGALDQRQRAAVPGSGVAVPTVLTELRLDRFDQLERLLAQLTGALDQAVDAVREARSAGTRRAAGVGVVRAAIGEADAAAAAQREAEREAERAEARWDKARATRVEADHASEVEHEALAAALAAWTSAAAAPDVVLPDELTREYLLGMPAHAQAAAAARLTTLREAQAQAASRRDTAEAGIERLSAQRADVEAERDPAPPTPVLPRTERTDGQALWQIVDFAPDLGEDTRAALEAALQAAGLLDAWVRPGGLLLDPHHHDVVLAAPAELGHGTHGGHGTEPSQQTLNGALRPDLPPGSDLTAHDVHRILAAIGTGSDPDAPAWITTTGAWRLGPTHGRAAKERAQFIGATARAQERTRRLAVIDAALAEQQAAFDEAQRDHDAHGAAIAELTDWVQAVPSAQALLELWTRLDERRQTEADAERDNRTAQGAAHDARAVAADARARVEQAARQQDLPADRDRLDAIEQELRSLDQDLRAAARQDTPIRAAAKLWAEAVEELADARSALAAEQQAAQEATGRANRSRTELDTLRASVGDSVQQLQRKIAEVKKTRRAHEQDERSAEQRASVLHQQHGGALADDRNAQGRLTEHLERRSEVLADLVAATSVPGMLAAAEASPAAVAAVTGLAGHPTGEPVPRQVTAAVDTLAGLSHDDTSATPTRVWRAHGEATSGPAADHQPEVATFGDLLAVTGRDDAGEGAIVVLAQRVSASVDRDRDLLTNREKQQFEQHILGELGDAIRRCRRDAEELVAAMNSQLGEVTTSQGIRVRLDWKLRDDVPPAARRAVTLLSQPVGALIPEERSTLHDALHSLIEASRAEHPELSYGEHLSAALDYRTWSQFTIRYVRPEKPGQWERLHRRSALSQGEQKVLCYLPLFAAAAAHFTSLAGAAPHAPRLVLLDDAFPKIDVRTQPLLFGLLVQLDLDFVITSERLWGDHETVPSLAIYEALRDPSERGIAQYEYRWDGRALHALG